MPRRKATTDAPVCSSYTYGDEFRTIGFGNGGYSRYMASQSASSTKAGKVNTSTSAILKALDEPSSSSGAASSKRKGKRRAKEVLGIEDGASAETPKPKRARKTKTKDPNAATPEKRAAIFKKKCPQNIVERLERVISQRFCLIDRRRNGDELREEFSVLGSTGNVYVVTIDRLPSCTCPDAMKGNHCKHILFIFCKVLQVPQSSHVWYQKALLTSELEEVFRNAPPAPNVMAAAQIRDAYNQATRKASSGSSSKQNRRMPSADDSCAICYECMEDANGSSLTWCETCGNALHKECFQQWARKKGVDLDCVYCRSPWTSSGSKSAGGKTREGYVNLAHVAGVSPVRDTSTYYQGPRRGQRYYGYQDYDDY
ncbi:hypothetical protein ACEPAI_4901 [Sanghuangporus weigelae]